jgi:hypothetical protein
MVDPDPRVSGYGLRYLRDNGVTVTVADKEEEAACRSLNAPFIFRILTERAYSVVLTSVDKEGTVNGFWSQQQPQQQREMSGESSKSPSPDSSEDLASLLRQLAPEINAIVLTSEQFLATPPSVLNALPSHIAVAVTVSSLNGQLSEDILLVRTYVTHSEPMQFF